MLIKIKNSSKWLNYESMWQSDRKESKSVADHFVYLHSGQNKHDDWDYSKTKCEESQQNETAHGKLYLQS